MKRNAIHRASSLVVAFALIISLLTVSSCKMRNLKIHINDFSRTETQVPNPMKGFVSFFGENDPDSAQQAGGRQDKPRTDKACKSCEYGASCDNAVCIRVSHYFRISRKNRADCSEAYQRFGTGSASASNYAQACESCGERRIRRLRFMRTACSILQQSQMGFRAFFCGK